MAGEVILEDRLETAALSYPFRTGWLDAHGVALTERVLPGDTGGATLALLDAVRALTLLDSHAILRDVAVVATRASFITLTTHTRPDEVDAVTVSIAGVSPVGRALATAVLQPFYGINVREWSEEPGPIDATHAAITEGARALIAEEDEAIYQEDLGRAWLLLVDKPLPTRLCVVPKPMLASDPAAIVATLDRLLAARDLASERGRELRRDLAKQHDVDRETLTETLAEQEYALSDAAADGLAELARRSGLDVSRSVLRRALVRLRREE